ncbi:MFS transporter [Neisseriaceae bacterium ESL0693]|nr:MFS transporter [Neisseriaceae bacterium ESL0693]
MFSFKKVFLACFLTSFSYGVMLTLPLFLYNQFQITAADSGKIISSGFIGILCAFFLLPRFLNKISIPRLAAISSFIYAFGIVIIISSEHISLFYLAQIFLGMGWGGIYTLGPMMVSGSCDEQTRSKNFSLIAAFNMLGAGMTPALVKILVDYQISYLLIFSSCALLSVLAAGLFLSIGDIPRLVQSDNQTTLNRAIAVTFRCPARYAVMMVLFGACIFSSMMSFQTLFAQERRLDFSFFYLSYTVAVIGARFLLTDLINRIQINLAVVYLLCIMAISMVLFNYSFSNLLYSIASALLGLSYGLVYPLIQNLSLKHIASSHKEQVLTVFSLFYFIGIYLFPFIGGGILSRQGSNIFMGTLFGLTLLELVIAVYLLYRYRYHRYCS